MNIVVCVKQTLNKYLDKENVMSDYDRNALDVGVKLKEKEIKTLSIDSIGISADKVGNAGSKTKVVNIYEPENISNCQFIDQDNDDENAKRLIDELNIDILINCQKGVS